MKANGRVRREERRALFFSLKTAGIEERRRDRNRGRYGDDSFVFLHLLSPFLYGSMKRLGREGKGMK